MSDRIAYAGLHGKVMIADEAVQFINHGDALGTSGFTSAGYPKVLPTALASRGKELHTKSEEFAVDIYTGVSTALDRDDVMAEADTTRYHMPYWGDSVLRKPVNLGRVKHQDIHLSHSALYTEQDFSPIDAAIVEVTRTTKDGYLIPSSSVGNNIEWVDSADKIIIEINSWQSKEFEGIHDIYRIRHLSNRMLVPINAPGDRIGTPYVSISLDKVVIVVETDASNRNSPFKPLDEISKAITGHFLDFPEGKVRAGRLIHDQYVMQSGVGNMLGAMMADPLDSKFENIKTYTEAIQDGIIDLIDVGKMTVTSTISFSLSPETAERMNNETARYRESIILRPQQIFNHPEVIHHVGLIVTGGMIETDIYGNVNSTRTNGSRMMSGIGGSSDFTRNAFVSSFTSPSLAEGGTISTIVPFASHTDHTEYDTMVIIIECGFTDLCGLAPRDRVAKMISVAYPKYQPLLEEHYERTLKTAPGMSTPHDLRTAFDFHVNMIKKGLMRG